MVTVVATVSISGIAVYLRAIVVGLVDKR
jgi:hypothetical protein